MNHNLTLITRTARSVYAASSVRSALLVLIVLIGSFKLSAQRVSFLRETVGISTATINVSAYTGWSNGSAYTHSQTGTVTTDSIIAASNYTGASGSCRVKMTGSSSWTISGINSTAYATIELSFGIFKTNKLATGAGMIIEVSSDGVTYTPLTMSVLPSGNGTGGTWYYKQGGVDVTGTIPATSNLRLRFRNTSTDLYYFDDIELTSAPIVLPIKLVRFSGIRTGVTNRLNWTTGNEEGVSHFDIQKSNNGVSFVTADQAKARNNGVLENYSVTDVTADAEVYYRLCTVQKNGSFQYSYTIKLSAFSPEIMVANNPVYDKITLISGKERKGKYYYTLTDLKGSVAGKGTLSNDGVNSIPTSLLRKGAYVLQLTNNITLNSFKIVVQ